MSQAEAVHPLQPAAGATAALVEFVGGLRHDALEQEVRHYARRHLLDTVGVMIAGAGGEVASRAEAMLAAVRPAGRIPVPGRARRADLLDAAFLGGTAAHGIELDDGYRQGSVHPGCAVVPAVLALGHERARERRGADRGDGRRLRADDRDRPRLPSRPAPARLSSDRRLRRVRRGGGGRQAARPPAPRVADALGIAASSAAGLFAFVNGGADIKRLHAGHAAREGLQAALLAEQGIEGPPGVIEAATASCRLSRSGAPTRRARSRCRPACRSASPIATSSPMPAAATSSRRSRR